MADARAPTFNFTGLHALCVEARDRHQGTIAFEANNGKGLFVFVVWIHENEKGTLDWTDVRLVLLLVRTQKVISRKLYGSHLAGGEFNVWFSEDHARLIRAELGIEDAGSGHFSLPAFLGALNAAIPQSLSLFATVNVIRRRQAVLRPELRDAVDEAQKIYLLGCRQLRAPQHPRERTLRKLYMLQRDPQAIVDFIRVLRDKNVTVCWTDKRPSSDAFGRLRSQLSRM